MPTTILKNLSGMWWTNEEGIIKPWYPDGDHCATIQDNLGLGIDAENVADLICKLINNQDTQDAG